ncbi:Dolichyl-phosphate-mannose-protein mannosyltransferase [Pilibacter termitis]|uniref:Dolichyl-phosphate-mannose-protein mannosyltransferase n=1 Tax=Pilibacter termitis TaxID=263852 RepID=A0A1T4M0H5_9ENTE|nr:glycosyltransferase family 39 protein [Pilibacter termitis]SJZ60483.1 Dolichyl-phosphate-mannose-protein mannosyltransferase [Pilibacter termitis]
MKRMKKGRNVLIIVLLTTSLLILLYTQIQNLALWRDEAFTLQLLQHPTSEILSLTAQDVHPPLYYLLAKPVQLLSGGDLSLEIRLLRLLSCLAIFLIAVLMYRHMRGKSYPSSTSLLTALLFTLMPHVLLSATDLRMYSFSQLFLFASYLLMLRFLETSDLKHLALCSITSLLCLYTNYFAGLGAGVLFLYSLIVWLKRKNFRKALATLMFGIGTILCYLPWLKILLHQLSTIQEKGFWIPRLSLRDFLLSFLYLISSADGNVSHKIAFVVLAVSLCLFLGFLFFVWKGGEIRKFFSDEILLGLFTPLMLLLIGLSVSILFRPIFLPRYLIVATPIFFVALFNVISLIEKRKQKRAIKKLTFSFFALTLLYTGWTDVRQFQGNKTLEDAIQSKALTNTPVLSDSNISARIATIYSQNVYENNPQSPLTKAVYRHFTSADKLADTLFYLSPNEKTDENEKKLLERGTTKQKKFLYDLILRGSICIDFIQENRIYVNLKR